MKRFLLVLIFVLCSGMSHAQDIKKVFTNMPDSILGVLSHNNRLDLIDFHESKMKSQVKNALEGTSSLIILSDDYLQVMTTNASLSEIIIFPQGYAKDSLFCVITTYSTPQPDSEIRFFNKKWKQLPSKKFLKEPQWREFLQIPEGHTSEELDMLLGKADIPLISAHYSPTDNMLHFSLSLDGGFTDLKEDFKPFVRREIVLHWDGKKFAKRQ